MFSLYCLDLSAVDFFSITGGGSLKRIRKPVAEKTIIQPCVCYMLLVLDKIVYFEMKISFVRQKKN